MFKRDSGIKILYGKEYNFGEMLSELNNDDTLSFFSKGYLYLIKSGSLVRVKVNTKTCFPYKEYTEVTTTKDILESVFLKADYENTSFIKEIPMSNVGESLIDGKEVLIYVDENMWVVKIEDDEIIAGKLGEDEDNENFNDDLAGDIVLSFIEGKFYVVD